MNIACGLCWDQFSLNIYTIFLAGQIDYVVFARYCCDAINNLKSKLDLLLENNVSVYCLTDLEQILTI
jgi:hypothetical protein